MEAWHGTYKSFRNFNLDFVGTGEGGKESGWGLYFSENRPGGEYYGEYLFERAKALKLYEKEDDVGGFLYRVRLDFADHEIISIKKPYRFENDIGYAKVNSWLSAFSDESDIQLAYQKARLNLGEKRSAEKLREMKIRVIHSTHGKKTHGESFIVLDTTIIIILNKYKWNGRCWMELQSLD